MWMMSLEGVELSFNEHYLCRSEKNSYHCYAAFDGEIRKHIYLLAFEEGEFTHIDEDVPEQVLEFFKEICSIDGLRKSLLLGDFLYVSKNEQVDLEEDFSPQLGGVFKRYKGLICKESSKDKES